MRSTANRLLCTRLLCVACARHIKDDECPHRITQSILEDRYCQLQQPNNTAIWTHLEEFGTQNSLQPTSKAHLSLIYLS